MATQYKTPGVYIQEPDSFPPAIVGVETAVPCFIGYTELARDSDGRDLIFTPKRVEAMAEFSQFFGERHRALYRLAAAETGRETALADGDIDRGELAVGPAPYRLVEAGGTRFNLYDSMRLFYANGGGACYVISCGIFGGGTTPAISADDIARALGVGTTFVGPTMVAVPDSVLLAKEEHGRIAALMLQACADAGDRMALIDIHGAESLLPGESWEALIADFRSAIAAATRPEQWRFGAAYFPALMTSIVSPDEIDLASFPRDADMLALAGKEALAIVQRSAAAAQGVLPPSGALAGIWAQNDMLRGVWNAPANTGIATMIRPALPITPAQQEELNNPPRGLAVNAIRFFQGRGNLVWGARTLDGNSNDWRYIQVRRTTIYVEQSVKQALEAMVSKPNTAQTWVTVTSMIESFLHGLWAHGGLMGASPGEAFNVQTGLGSTMTPQDVLEGVMRVHITLQMIHPAEFIELTFKRQMLGGA